jgi:hypothetical protein
MTQRSGQCLCGAVRFTLTADPLAVRVCWCKDCQHLAANGTVNMLVPAAALSVSGVVADHTARADSGNAVTRQFCPTCGTHLFAKSDARPQVRVVRVGNLEDPSSVQPTANIWSTSAPAWACLDSGLEQVERQPIPPAQPAAAAKA